MKIAEAVATLLIVFGVLGLLLYAVVRGRLARWRLEHARWRVRPKTLESGDRQVWIIRPGEPDFLYDTVRRDDFGHFNADAWDEALYGAEQQALEFERLERER
jgi:hypothetical protein